MSAKIKASLNIYDLIKYNPYVHCVGLGAYHTGIEVNGVEWAYGHAERGTGVYPCLPGTHPNGKFREKIDLGYLDLTVQDVAYALDKLRPAFSGHCYHLLYKNCNHFTAALYYELTKKKAPSYINRLAAVGRCLICCLPEYLQPRPGIDVVSSTDTKLSLSTWICKPFRSCFSSLIQSTVTPDGDEEGEDLADIKMESFRLSDDITDPENLLIPCSPPAGKHTPPKRDLSDGAQIRTTDNLSRWLHSMRPITHLDEPKYHVAENNNAYNEEDEVYIEEEDAEIGAVSGEDEDKNIEAVSSSFLGTDSQVEIGETSVKENEFVTELSNNDSLAYD